MVVAWISQQVEHTAGCTGLGIGRRINDPCDPCMHYRHRAHRTRFEADVERASDQPVIADALAGSHRAVL